MPAEGDRLPDHAVPLPSLIVRYYVEDVRTQPLWWASPESHEHLLTRTSLYETGLLHDTEQKHSATIPVPQRFRCIDDSVSVMKADVSCVCFRIHVPFRFLIDDYRAVCRELSKLPVAGRGFLQTYAPSSP
jgi:hypothetical protein